MSLREDIFTNAANLCVAGLMAAKIGGEAMATGGAALIGLAGLAVRIRERHGPECALVQARIKREITEKYGALAQSPEHAADFARVESVLGETLRV